jgi:hypothetical protein
MSANRLTVMGRLGALPARSSEKALKPFWTITRSRLPSTKSIASAVGPHDQGCIARMSFRCTDPEHNRPAVLRTGETSTHLQPLQGPRLPRSVQTDSMDPRLGAVDRLHQLVLGIDPWMPDLTWSRERHEITTGTTRPTRPCVQVEGRRRGIRVCNPDRRFVNRSHRQPGNMWLTFTIGLCAL